MLLIPSIITVMTGLFILILGFLIRFGKMVELIAGYNPEKIKDKDGFVKWIGSNLILMGLLIVFISGTVLIIHIAGEKSRFHIPEMLNNSTITTFILIPVTLLICVRTAIGSKNFWKR